MHLTVEMGALSDLGTLALVRDRHVHWLCVSPAGHNHIWAGLASSGDSRVQAHALLPIIDVMCIYIVISF